MSNLSDYDFEDDFCGGQFWNFRLLWDVEKPDFTGCFQKTIFSWIPVLVIIFFSLFEVPGYLSKHNWNRNIKLNLYNLAKFILIFCLIVVNVTQIGFSTKHSMLEAKLYHSLENFHSILLVRSVTSKLSGGLYTPG